MIPPANGAASDLAPFRFNVLGPFEARYDQRPIQLTGVARTVLAVLVASPGRVVSVAAIVTGLWNAEPPVGAEKAVASYVSRLRRVLGSTSKDINPAAVVVTRSPGYVLAVPSSSVDAVEFETSIEQARRAAAAEQPVLAAERYGRALALWRGEAYAEFGDHPFAQVQRTRLEELRMAAVEARIDAQLASGSPAGQLVADLETLVAEHPHRERMWAQLMTALYREGRQAHALDAYQRARVALVDELGVEPGADLRAAEKAVLVGDPAMSPPRPSVADVPAELGLGAGACVGRDLELSWLATELDTAAYEGGRACLVVGSEGIGKTTLMAELAERAAERGVTVRYGRGGQGVDALAGGPRLHLVILDDVERLDEPDVVRVESWLRATRGRPVLTVLTCGADPPPAPFVDLPRLELMPLSSESVATVIRSYSPDVPDSTVNEIAEHARGVPARVHHAARDWATARAGRRVDHAVGQLGDRRQRLETARADMVAAVLEVARVRARAEAYGGLGQPTVACPYKGLARFELADADFFHGRDRLVAELVARVVDAPLVTVVGASGSGKSSAVRAGLLAALQAGVLPGSGAWRQVILTPATASAGLPDPVDGRTILVIDQFEEAFTALMDTERTNLVEAIAATLRAGTTTVVLTVRSDYLARCAEDPVLGGAISGNTVAVARMAADELRQAVEVPAGLAGLRLEDGLVDLLVDQARDAPGALPLLSVALVSLWERRSGRTLTVAAYRESGGVAGSVERLGEQAFAALEDDEERDAARRMLLRLASSRDGQTIAARRADRTELMAVGGATAARVLDVLLGRRLVSVADDSIEVAHEALFSHWPRLRNWLAEDADGRALRGHLAPAARAWADGDGDPGELYRGARLAAVLDWAATRGNELVPIERDFLEASRDAAVAEQVRQRRNVRRLRTLLVAAVTALVVAIAGSAVAVNQQRRADTASRVADAKRLGIQALIEPDLPRAMLLAAEATRLDDSWQTRGNLLATLLRTPNLIHAARITETDKIYTQAISPDGRLIAVAGQGGITRVMDAETLRPIATLPVVGHMSVLGLTFTPDSKRLVTWGGDPAVGSSGRLNENPISMLVWDIASGQQEGLPFGFPVPVGGALLADGRTIVVNQEYAISLNSSSVELSAPKIFRAMAWDLQTRQPSQLVHLPDTPASGVNVSTDGRQVVIDGPDGITVAGAFTGLNRLLPGVHGFAALAPDGHTVAVTDPNGRDITVWDVATGLQQGVAHRHTAPATRIAWAPDGRSFTSVGEDSLVVVWNAATLTPRLVFTGHTSPAQSVSYSPDGRSVYTSGPDGMLLQWDITGSRTLDRVVHQGTVPSDSFDPIAYDSRNHLFYFDDQATLVHRVDAETGVEVGIPIRVDPNWNGIQLSPNGRYLTVSYGDGGAEVFDALAGRRLTGLIPTPGVRARFAETDPTGRFLAVAVRDADFIASLELFDIRTGQRREISPADREGPRDPWRPIEMSLSANNGTGLRFSPDGQYLAVAMINGEVAVFDVPSHRLVTDLSVYPEQAVTGPLEFSPDGHMLTVGGDPGQLTAWHVGTWTRAWTANVTVSGPVGSIGFSPDGQLIAMSAFGGLLLFDAATGEAIGTPLTTNGIVSFAPDGKSLLILAAGAGVHRWDVDPQSWVQRACAIAGSDFTDEEWQRYLPGRPHEAVCLVNT